MKGKYPPVKGFTGHEGADVTDDQVTRWCRGPEGRWNIALRLPDGVVGIDVDHYDDKHGADTLGKAVAELGDLPPTWSVTSRGLDQPARIHLYRVPGGLDWSGAQAVLRRFGRDVDIIWRHWRYAMVAPSIHPTTGQPYRWYLPDPGPQPVKGIGDKQAPEPGDLAEMPGAWVQALTDPRHPLPVTQEQEAAQERPSFDLEGFIRAHLKVAQERPWPGGGRRWVLSVCPFDSQHTDLSAFVGRRWDGAIVAGCQHNSCGDWKWSDLRAKFDPPARRGEASTVVRRLRLTQASKIPPKPVRWTWEGRIPAGAVTLIPGREGIGKSLLEVWLTARLTRGELPGVHHGTPRPVLYAATEDSWERTIVGRLTAAGADLDLVYRVEVEEEDLIVPLTLPIDCAALAEEIGGRGGAMLALDPLMSAISSAIDTHRDRELRLALEPLAGLADATGCAVVGLAHFNKSPSTDVLNLVTGSRAFTAVLRSVIAVARDPDDEAGTCVLSQAKNNLGRLDLPSLQYVIASAEIPTDEGPAQVGRLEFTGETDRTVAQILGERGDADSRSERDEAAEFIADYLLDAGGEADAGQVLKAGEAAGFAKRTLQEARRRAGVQTRKSEFRAGWVWALTAEGAAKAQKAQGHGDLASSAPSVAPWPGWAFAEPLVPCVRCGDGTSNRDPEGRPVHLLCAEVER